MDMGAHKIKVNESIINTYSYLKGNFSEDDFVFTSESDSKTEIHNDGNVYVSFGNGINYDEVSKNINVGVNQNIVDSLKSGKCIDIKFKDKSSIDIKNIMDKDFSTMMFNIECMDDDSHLYFHGEVSGEGKQFNHLYNINLKGNSELTMVIFLNSDSKGFINVLANCDNESRVDILFVNINRNNVYTNCNVYLNGENSSSNIDVCYICSDDCKFDYNVTSSMIGKKSNANINGKGILLGKCRKIFRGTIDFKKGCCGAEGHENEEVIILSKECKNQSLPLLLCKEKNVKGSHGFTANSIDNDKVFYLSSRGFSEKEAKALILKGKFLSLLNKVKNEEVIDEFMDVLLKSV